MRRIWMPLLCLLLAATAKADDSEQILMSIGDTQITKGEFEYIFNKNNSATQNEPTSLDEYVDMFVKFKLKVIEAESQGMDTTQAFKDELAGYRDQLAKPYLIDQKLSDEMVETAYFRMANEVNASHILLRLANNPRPDDTLKLYNKAIEIREMALNGEDFSDLARKYSEDPSAQMNGGNLNYFTGFQMVYPFEEAAYTTPKGEISMPIRTRFGYHLIKVNDMRKSRGEVKVAHILFLEKKEMTAEDKEALKARAWETYEEVKTHPEAFGAVAEKESDDYGTAKNGGELNWFSTGQMVYEFQEVAYNLENGKISEPFQTQFGWHIVKKIDERPFASYDEKKSEIKQLLARSERGKQPEESFILKLQKEYGFHPYDENIADFVDISKNYQYKDSAFYKTTRGMEKSVFTLDSVDVSFTQQDFADYIFKEDNRSEIPNTQARVNQKWDRYYRKTLKDFENGRLEEKYPDFRYLMQEYHDGILLFEISQNEVWNKASRDTTGLEKFYKKTKKKYPWETAHYSGKVYLCANDSVQALVNAMIKAKASDQAIADSINGGGVKLLAIKDGIFAPGDNAAIDALIFGDATEDAKYKSVIMAGKTFKAGVPRELEFVRGAVISEYQDYLEEKWVKQLKKKYKVNIDDEVLKTVEIKNSKS